MQFEHVRYRYPRQTEAAVTDLTFTVEQGEFLGILGADNSGKSTIARLMNGLLLPSSGKIRIADQQLDADVETLSALHKQRLLYEVRQKVGVVFADPENQIVGTTVAEDVAFGLGNLQLPPAEIRTRIEVYLKQVGLAQYAERAPHTLSGGEQQKLCIAGVLAMQTDCLVLDEPLTFLDSASREEILELLNAIHASGKTIVYVSAAPEELLRADRILFLSRGQIVGECTPALLWNTPALFEKIGVMIPDLVVLRIGLITSGFFIQAGSLTPEAIVEDICDN